MGKRLRVYIHWDDEEFRWLLWMEEPVWRKKKKLASKSEALWFLPFINFLTVAHRQRCELFWAVSQQSVIRLFVIRAGYGWLYRGITAFDQYYDWVIFEIIAFVTWSKSAGNPRPPGLIRSYDDSRQLIQFDHLETLNQSKRSIDIVK